MCLESPWRRSRAPAIPYLTAPSTSFLNATASCSGAARFSSTIPTSAPCRGRWFTWNTRSRTPRSIGQAVGESFPVKCSSWSWTRRASLASQDTRPIDYRPSTDGERLLLGGLLEEQWVKEDLQARAISYAAAELVPRHFEEVRHRKEEQVSKTLAAVKERLTKEITYWDHRAEELKAQELAGKTPRLNSGKARQRADDLQGRLQRRMEELEQERRLSPLPPVVARCSTRRTRGPTSQTQRRWFCRA